MNKVVNVRLTKEYNVYCGRKGKGMEGQFGNPFIVGVHGQKGECVKKFEDWLFNSKEDKAETMRNRILKEIKSNDILGCFCVDGKGNGECHAKVIAKFIQQFKK